MTLGKRLRELRKERGWSQRDLAMRACVRQALLSELEADKKEDTTGAILRKLARAFHVSVDYLIGTYGGPLDP